MSIHEQHRKRMIGRFLSHGLERFEPHQALEMLLYFSIPRKDTNPLAHQLIGHFGSLSAVLDARPEELMKVPGVGTHTAALLSMMPQLWRLYRMDRLHGDITLDSALVTGAYALDLFAGHTRETFYLLCLNNNCQLLQAARLHEGTVNETIVHPRLVVEAALRYNAAQVIFAHNHPGGDPAPSGEDIRYTRRVAVALATIGIPVIDHIVVSDSGWYSFSREGKIEEINREVSIRIAERLTPYRTE